MSKTLVIAEKPSVAKDIVNVLRETTGRFISHDHYQENDSYIVSHAVGHLVEIYSEEAEKPPRWSLNNLPKIPSVFDIRPIKGTTKDQLKILTSLIGRKDVDVVINACDAGREGELIFRLIFQYALQKNKKCDKVIKRLWLQSMTKESIAEGFKNLRTDLQMKNLEDAARCRAEADWLIGINGSRALTAYNSTSNSFSLTPVGRVQTPTLSLLVNKEELISLHKPRTYYEVFGDILLGSGEAYKAKFFDPSWKKKEDPEDKSDRIWLEAEALRIVKDLHGKRVENITEESKSQVKHSPGLFDLTTLQREANTRFGMSAKNTLSVAQALYEKHKVLTYPRTDSKHLPEDYLPTVLETFRSLSSETQVGGLIDKAFKNNYFIKTKKVFDNSKISDHFAIIPTGKYPNGLDEYERKIFDLVLKRSLAAFYPAAEVDVVTRVAIVKGHHFKTEGKVLRIPGWMEVYGKSDDSNDVILPQLTPNEVEDGLVYMKSLEAETKVTKPPARYNEATLLGAMETAGKRIEDASMREAMKDRGLGTPATRASILEGLITSKYITREGKELIPTEKAKVLIMLLKGLKIDILTSPELTGQWEANLLDIERGGKTTRESFMANIGDITRFIVKQAKEVNVDDNTPKVLIQGSSCPRCSSELLDGFKSYTCSKGCGVSLSKVVGNRPITPKEIVHLTSTGPLGPVEGFRSRFGKKFEAILTLKLKDEKWDIALTFPEKEVEEFLYEKTGEAICKCPICKSDVFDYGAFFSCEKREKCKFKVNKTILSRHIDTSELRSLADKGKTDVLEGFISKSKGRPFNAHLVWDKVKKGIVFEFEEKERKKKK